MRKRILLLALAALLTLSLALTSCGEASGDAQDSGQSNLSSDTSTGGTQKPIDPDVEKPTDTDEPADTGKPSDPNEGGSSAGTHTHNWEEWKTDIDASCGRNGIKTHTCLGCGAFEYEEIPALTHEYEATEVPPQYGISGYVKYECKNCGDTYTEKIESEYSLGLLYSVNDDGKTCTVTSADGCYDKVVKIPPEIDGYTVTKIGRNSFEYRSAETVIIPDTVTEIEDGAFWGCMSLTFLTIGEGVEKIGSSAFKYCEKLIDIENRSSLTLEAGSNENGGVAQNAMNIHTGEGKGVYEEIDGFSFYEFDGAAYMISYDGYESILVLPTDYNGKNYEIYKGVFSSMPTLYSVTIPSGVAKIHDGAFSFQASLVEVINLSSLEIVAGDKSHGGIAENAIEVHDKESKLTAVGEYLFYNSDENNYLIAYTGNETEITLPTLEGNTYSIYNKAFYIKTITKAVIPEGVTAINNSAFYFCDSLTEVTLPSTLVEIGDSAFYGCAITKIEIPSSVEKIGDNALASTKLTEVTVPNSVKTLGYGAFSDCESLVSVSLGSGVDRIEAQVFAGCTSLAEIEMLGRITRIESRAFENCGSLQSFEIPSSVKSIGMYSFDGCDGLTEIIIPDSVETMWIGAFNNCSSLKKVELGGGLTSLDSDTFRGTVIEEIYIPDNIKIIDGYAFYMCGSLKRVCLPALMYDLDANAFKDAPSVEFYYRGSAADLFEYNLKQFESNNTLYVYSEDEPSDSEYKYWHYGANNEILIWE